MPIQNPFNPFTEADYTSREERTLNFRQSNNCCASRHPLTTGVHYLALEAGPSTDKITTHNYEFTGGLKGNLGEFGDYFKTWQWESGFRYNEDNRIERFARDANLAMHLVQGPVARHQSRDRL